MSGRITVLATTSGTVLAVPVGVGDQVGPDELVALLEVMKMEIPVVSGVSGTIAAVHVTPGDQVEIDQALAEIES